MLTFTPQSNLRNAREYFEKHLVVGDYYSRGQVVPGEWMGVGAERLGLAGVVGKDEFVALCENLHPVTGEQLTPLRKTIRQERDADGKVKEVANRRLFYDVTISPPKSVSIAALVKGDGRIVESHDRAVRVAMRELERFAATRVRRDGRNDDRDTGELVTAIFRHDTSRAVDPQLHSHCIVFNATFDEVEGRWKALQAEEMHKARKYAENVYYHELARDLRRFGYGIVNKARGDFELEGVPHSLIWTFSKRDRQIDEQTRELLAQSPELAGANIAEVRAHLAHKLRPQKAEPLSPAELQASWQEQMSEEEKQSLEALGAGQHPGEATEVVDFSTAREWADFAYADPTPETVSRLKQWLRENPDAVVRLYHGTASSHPIREQGILRTGKNRRNSLQSRAGFVSLSIYPGVAETFAKMAYPEQEVSVYPVEVPVRLLVADADQLGNKRYWGERSDIGSSLADSLAFSHGATIKGDVPPWAVKPPLDLRDDTAPASVEAALRWAEDHVFDRHTTVVERQLWAYALERGRGESFTLEDLHAATANAPYIHDPLHPEEFSIQSVLDRETAIIQLAQESANACANSLVPDWPGDARLDAAQAEAARRILSVRDSIVLFRGRAGTGKSFTLRAVYDALQAEGHAVQVAGSFAVIANLRRLKERIASGERRSAR